MKSKTKNSRSGSLSTTLHYVCQICKDSFRSVDQFLSHKKRRHPKQLSNQKHIVFEEKFIEIGPDATGNLHPPFVLLERLAFDPETGSMESNSNQNNNILKTSNRSTTSASSAPHLQNPSRIEELEPEPEQSKPDFGSVSSMSLELFDDDTYGLTDAEMYRFISNDEIVDLPNPYIRINQLTPKQLEIKAQATNTKLGSFTPNLTSNKKRPASTSTPLANKKIGRKSQSVSKYTRIMPMLISESSINSDESSDSDSGSDINFSRRKAKTSNSSIGNRKREITKKFVNYNESDDSSTSVSSSVVKTKSKQFKSRFEKDVEIISDDDDSDSSGSDGWGKKSDGERDYKPPKWFAQNEKRTQKKSSTGSKFVKVAKKKRIQEKPKTNKNRKTLYKNIKKIMRGD